MTVIMIPLVKFSCYSKNYLFWFEISFAIVGLRRIYLGFLNSCVELSLGTNKL